jgi:glycosyltransferase involved in cell wall biosynthesis
MKISVVIPCYNSAPWVSGAVESALAQTRPAEEIIVVDDGSTDDPAAVLSRFGDRVRLVRRANGGLSAARNTGVSVATGDHFLFLDADDRLFPDALEKLSAHAAATGAGVVYGFAVQRRKDPTETRLNSRPYAVGPPPKPAEAAFYWTPIATAGCALIDRALNDKVGGFDENFRQVEDAEYWLRCGVTRSFAHTDTIVLDKAFHGDSLGQKRGSSIWHRLQLQRKFLDWCAHRKTDTAFLGATPRQMVDHAMTQAWRAGEWGLLGPLLGQAHELGVGSPWCIRAKIKMAQLKFLGKLPPRPDYCRNVWNLWRAAA